MEFLGSWFIPTIVISGVIAFFIFLRIVSRNYIKVPPNKVAVFYGTKHKTADGRTVGFRVVSGGAKFRVPLFESVAWLDLNVFSIDLVVKGAPNKDGVLVNVRGVANVKILSDDVSLMAAAERFLGREQPEIKDIAFKNLEGHLRAIIGRLSVEDIVSDRSKFNQEVRAEAAEDLRKIGMGVDVLTVQEIDDDYGYIKALGQKRTAEVQRDATIGKADAERDATISATTAQKEAAAKQNENLALIAFAEKERDVKKAQFLAQVEKEKATASQAGPLAEAEAKKLVVETQVEVERIRTKKQTEVAIAEAEKREKELLATIVKPAEAKKLAMIEESEGEKQKMIKMAEAQKSKDALEGEGRGEAIRLEGKGKADAIEAQLLAEAKGTLEKAQAYKQLTKVGWQLEMMEVMKELIPAALEKMPPIMEEIAKPFASVDRITLVDFGGNGGDGGALGKFAQVVPMTLMKVIESCKAAGIDPTRLVETLKLGMTDTEAKEEIIIPTETAHEEKETNPATTEEVVIG